MTPQNNKDGGFEDLGIVPKLLAGIHARGITEPTAIQRQAIPVAITGKDVIGIAQTGTGKTLAFGLPMIQQLGKVGGRGLILLPTRELALQVDEELQKTVGSIGLRTVVVIGGESEGKQLRQIQKKPHIIVATPGRLVDFLERGKVFLGDVSVLVLDEADRMFDMGFAPQLKKILLAIPRQRQTMLFSATMPQNVVRLAKEHMGWPVRIEIAPQGTTAEHVNHELFIVPRAQKLSLLAQILHERSGSVILFSRTKYGAKGIANKVRRMDCTAVEIHGNRSQPQRKEALDGFKAGKYRVLVATDIAARGIDVQDVAIVLNYDLPMTAEDYVHRIGRTARAGKSGCAISFATPEQMKDIQAIERLIRKQLPRSPLPKGLPASIPQDALPARGPRRSAAPRRVVRPENRAPGQRTDRGRPTGNRRPPGAHDGGHGRRSSGASHHRRRR
ncbi:MAG: DEAD/DEAH box helicase [Candidatus Uhrbacteria bacterium]